MEYHILDFSNWEDNAELDRMFKRLIDGLDMFYKKIIGRGGRPSALTKFTI